MDWSFIALLFAIYGAIAIIASIAFVVWGERGESADDYHY